MPLYILACRVLQTIMEPYLRAADTLATFMEYGFHRTPQLMTPALQEELDKVAEPSVFIIGYGLCGNGLAGLKARQHTLIVPRADDCISLLLGSYERYIQEFSEEPGTYYLTKGWLESGSHPLKEYRELLEKYDQETADWILDEQYRNYKRIVFVASSEEERESYRHKAKEAADFCVERWGFRYEERVGTNEFVDKLMTVAREFTESNDDFLVIPPGGEIKQEMYWR
ncbi:MAG: DUF1638 domain-containing protein [Chloroflexi bacterium]|nr:DUF1638 domain-containing protein [Chloroflexota bacterium]